MPPRDLTDFETSIAAEVVSLGTQQDWEFAAFLEAPKDGPPKDGLIEMRTLRVTDRADPSMDVHLKAKMGAKIVVHHNHLSQESLSFADWRGLSSIFEETFAHCADGTIYWGRVLDRCAVEKMLRCKTQAVEVSAENLLFAILGQTTWSASATDLACFFRKEVVNRAMRICKYVEYEFAWGTTNITAPSLINQSTLPFKTAGGLGAQLDTLIDKAAIKLAQNL